MFFSAPLAAFANIAAGLRPRARLVLLVWQRRQDNEWARLIDAALGDAAQPPPRGADRSRSAMPRRPRASSRAPASTASVSRTSTSRSSTGATWRPRSRSIRGFQETSTALASLSDDEAARTVERLRETLSAHHSDERGVVLDSRSWLITARIGSDHCLAS
jgi:hypothetical protein